MLEGTIGEKTRQCCKNLEAVLKEAGSSITRVVKCNIFLSDMAHFAVSSRRLEKRILLLLADLTDHDSP
jgi:enamine deaminase RidA (YjgF/YER057c/UK114 family)